MESVVVVGQPDEATSKPASKRPFVIVGLVILTGLVVLVSYVVRHRGLQSTDDARVEGHVVMISVRVPGLVVSVPAGDNHRIKKGDLIAQVDDTEYAARLKQAQAELAQARAQAAQAEAQEVMVAASAKGGIAAGRAVVAGSSYAVRSAHANIASARAALERAQVMSGALWTSYATKRCSRPTLPQSTLDDAQAAANRAHATVAQARATLSASEEDLHAAGARVSEAQGHATRAAGTGLRGRFRASRIRRQVDTIAGGTQGRFSLLPSDNAAENFVKVVQRVPVKVRLAATDAVLLPGLSAGVTVNVRP